MCSRWSNSNEPKTVNPLNPTDQKASSYVKIIFKGLVFVGAVGLLYGAKVLYEQSKIPQAIIALSLAIAAIAYVSGLCGLCSRQSTKKTGSDDKNDVEKIKVENEKKIKDDERLKLENEQKKIQEDLKKIKDDEERLKLENEKKIKADEERLKLENEKKNKKIQEENEEKIRKENELKKIQLDNENKLKEEQKLKLENFKNYFPSFCKGFKLFDINNTKNLNKTNKQLKNFTNKTSGRFTIQIDISKDLFNHSEIKIIEKEKKEFENIIEKIYKAENDFECVLAIKSLNNKILALQSKWPVLKK